MGVNSIYILFIVGMFFILSFVRHSTFLARRTNNLYCAAVIVNIFSYIAYIYRGFFEQRHWVAAANIDEIIIYAGSPLIAFFLLLCNCKPKSKLHIIFCVSQIVYTLLCISSAFNGLLFTVDKYGAYSRGPLSDVAFIYAALMEIIWVVYILTEYKSSLLREKVQIVTVAFIEMIAIFLQIIDSTYKFSLLGSSFFIILFYIFLIEIEGKYDKMTKIFNKRYYSIITNGLTNNYSIIVLDINGLKIINDTMGHEIGDKLIKNVAEALKNAAGDDSSVYRIGGDEFVMIVKTTKKETIDIIIDSIKQNFRIKESELGMEVSASIGTAINTDETDYANLFRIADANMYEDKCNYYKITGKRR